MKRLASPKCLGCVLAGALAAAMVFAAGGCTQSSPAAIESPVAAAPDALAPAQVQASGGRKPPEEARERTSDASSSTSAPEDVARSSSTDNAPTASGAAAPVVPVSNPPNRFQRPPLPTEPPPGPKVVRPKSAKGARGVEEITFDAIKFDIEKGDPFERTMIPESIESLLGRRIKIYGYIHPSSAFQQTGIKQFILVRDNLECCFGPGAALYDCIAVRMKENSTANYTTRPIAVEGTFTIEEKRGADGKHLAIYRLDGEVAK